MISGIVDVNSMDALKKLCYDTKNEISNLFMVVGAEANGKAMLAVMIDEAVAKEKKLDAGKIIKEISVEIKGGGGGQPHFASAGGTNAEGLKRAIEIALQKINTVTV